MYCTKCGRDIGANSLCPYCGGVPKISDFVLDAPGTGGFIPVSNLSNSAIDQGVITMDTLGTDGVKSLCTVGDSAIAEGLDPLGESGFKSLGPVSGHAAQEMDSSGRGGFKPLQPAGGHAVYGETQGKDPPGSGGFKPLGHTGSTSAFGKIQDPLGRGGFKPLDPAENPVSGEIQKMDTMGGGGFKPPVHFDNNSTSGRMQRLDAHGSGGFKPVDERSLSNDGVEIINETDLPAKSDIPNSKIVYAWKKWMAIATSILTVIIAVFLFCLSPRENVYEVAIADRIASEMIQGDELPLAYQYNNAVLNFIDFQFLDMDKSADTATVRFTYVDVLSLADTYSGSMNDTNLFYKYCIDQIVSGSAPTLTRTISVAFATFDSGEVKRIIALDSVDFADVLTGGVASEYAKLSGGD